MLAANLPQANYKQFQLKFDDMTLVEIMVRQDEKRRRRAEVEAKREAKRRQIAVDEAADALAYAASATVAAKQAERDLLADRAVGGKTSEAVMKRAAAAEAARKQAALDAETAAREAASLEAKHQVLIFRKLAAGF